MVKKIYTSVKGKVVDFDSLQGSHEQTIAVGNAGYNARGDLLGAGGRIAKTAEQIANETTVSSVEHVARTRNVSIKDDISDMKDARLNWVTTPASDIDPEDAMDISEAAALVTAKPKVETKTAPEPEVSISEAMADVKEEKSAAKSTSKRKIVDED